MFQALNGDHHQNKVNPIQLHSLNRNNDPNLQNHQGITQRGETVAFRTEEYVQDKEIIQGGRAQVILKSKENREDIGMKDLIHWTHMKKEKAIEKKILEYL